MSHFKKVVPYNFILLLDSLSLPDVDSLTGKTSCPYIVHSEHVSELLEATAQAVAAPCFPTLTEHQVSIFDKAIQYYLDDASLHASELQFALNAFTTYMYAINSSIYMQLRNMRVHGALYEATHVDTGLYGYRLINLNGDFSE